MRYTRFQGPGRRVLNIGRRTRNTLNVFPHKIVTRCRRVASLCKLVFLSIVFCAILCLFFSHFTDVTDRIPWIDHRFDKVKRVGQRGAYAPEEPWRLTGLQLRKRTYTRQDLLAVYSNMSFIYSFVNGSELNHFYRKFVARNCRPLRDQPATGDGLRGGNLSSGPAPQWRCHPGFFSTSGNDTTLDDIRSHASFLAGKFVNNLDRESDELRHSLRSVEQHIRWHRGRVVMVSPGHHPHWVDSARNFFAGSCGGVDMSALRERGQHLRLTTVHQDAILPYGLRLTLNSHIIEQHLWRVRNTTCMHVYFNDDYFVNKDADISDFLNEYGGSVVRVENSTIKMGRACNVAESWIDGVYNTELFNIIEVDQSPEDFLPNDLIIHWRGAGRLHDNQTIMDTPPQAEVVNTAYSYEWSQLSFIGTLKPRRARYHLTHAPFVYCTNMFRFLNTRYEREFAFNALRNRFRMGTDIYIPAVYNAFIMTRPWQASPKLLPYLWRLQEYRQLVAECRTLAAEQRRNQSMPLPPRCKGPLPVKEPPKASIVLDNTDGCAPATLLVGSQSDAFFTKLGDNISSNEEVMREVDSQNPLFFNINANFRGPNSVRQMLDYMRRKFPNPMYLERGAPPASSADAALAAVYDALMELPVIAVASFVEGVCPLVRSLQLSLPDHRGGLTVGVRPLNVGGVEPTLGDLRAEQRDGVWAVMLAVGCAYNERVHERVLQRERNVMDLVRDVIGGGGAGVWLPASCGASGDVRVRGFVIDAQTSELPAMNTSVLRGVLAIPGQTLALEDFDVVRLDDKGTDAVLVLSRTATDAKGVHWITGASEADLLQTYPLPYTAYENMSAKAVWV